MEQLVKVIEMTAINYPNVKVEIFGYVIRLKFYIKDDLYKELQISKEDKHLKVLILPNNITKILNLEETSELISILDKETKSKKHTQREIEMIKQKYKIGTKVQLVKMYDYLNPVPIGTKGTITNIDSIGTLDILWENGRTLGLIVGLDEFKIIE